MIGTRERRALTAKSVAKAFRTSVPKEVHEVLAVAGEISKEAGGRAYLVGGIVRDIAIGYPNTDLDVMIEGDAERVARRLAERIGGRFKKPTEFGTCKVETLNLGTIDFAVARSETYRHPGALPEVASSDIERDLWRRDFTINAMAISLDPADYGKVLDPCGGIEDLKRGTLRVMHDASFRDDPTRILRGVRFAARYDFKFEARTLRLARECLAQGCLATISGKRVARELLLICSEPNAPQGIRMLETLGILDLLRLGAPEARRRHFLWREMPRAMTTLRQLGLEDCADPATCWFASIFAGSGTRGARQAGHFNLPAELRDTCAWAATALSRAERRLASLDQSDPYRVTKFLGGIPPAGLVVLYAASARRARHLIARYLSEWRHVKPRVTGGEIAAMGAGPGPHIRKLLDRILRLRLDGRLPTRADELEYVKRAISLLR